MDFLIVIVKYISIGGIGAFLFGLYNNWRGRTYEKRLLLDVKTSSKPLDDKRVLFVEVILTNAGKGKLDARRVGPNDYVYKDADEQLKYSCSLQVKRVNTQKLTDETFLDWYKSSALEAVSGIPAEINLLDDYIVPAESNRVIFWLEPGDIAHLPAPLVLQPGHYLLKVSFYGPKFDEDFWTRLVYVCLE